MTKEEHMTTIDIELDEEIINKIEADGLSAGTILEGYVDALKFGWENTIKTNPTANAKYQVRLFLMERINQIDEEIDEIVKSMED